MQYLQDKQHYIDRYDLLTIEECLDNIRMVQDIGNKMKLDSKMKSMPKEELDRNMNLMMGRILFAIKGHRFKNRMKTIEKWIDRDRVKQDKQENTPPPVIACPDCKTAMVADDYRHLEDWPEDKPMRVLFIFNCPKCKKRLGVYDDGEMHESKLDICSKCGKKMAVKTSRKNKVVTTHYKCKSCGHSKKDILDLNKSDQEHKKWEAEQKETEKRDKKLLEEYRDEFCLSEKEGREHVKTLEAMEVAHVVYEETLAESDNPAQEKLMTLKKLSITDLEKLLNKTLIKNDYTRLSLDGPEINRHVVVTFTVQDNTKRHGRESIYDLYELLKNALKDTNWRASKDDMSYRLGFISGKLKGYENEEHLLKLVGKEEPKKPKSKLDPKQREKYGYHNLVQLARMNAEFEAKERMRKRRLKKEPEGFFLNDGGRGYTCGICGEPHDGEDIWWREDGLRCRNCWQNIKKGVIPILDLDKENWEQEDFIKSWQIKSHYGVHPATAGKLRREGLLVGRDLKNSEGRIYCTIYLVSENKKFLKKYPKQSKNAVEFD